MKLKFELSLALTSAGALAGWTRPPSHGDKSKQFPGPDEEKQKGYQTFFFFLFK